MELKGWPPAQVRFALSLGGYFAWLLSFPVFGPALGALAASRGGEAGGLVEVFLPAHALGLAVAGTFGARRLPGGRALAAVIVTCGLLGLSLSALPAYAWRGVMLLLGLLSAGPIIAWMARFPGLVPPGRRARTMALVMAVANLPLYALTLAQGRLGPTGLALASTAFLLLPLACTPFTSPDREGATPAKQPVAGCSIPPAGLARRFPWPLAMLILAMYLIGGTAYQMVYPTQSSNSAITLYVGVLPYVATALLASGMAVTAGRTWLAQVGLSSLGIAIVLFPLADRFPGNLLSHVLVQGGYAAADLFLWTYLADLAPPGREAAYYGWGLGLNVAALFAGCVALTRWLSFLALSRVAVAVAGAIPLFLAAPPAGRLPAPGLAPPEASPQPPSSPYGPGGPGCPVALLGLGLTAREKEIALLLLEGLSNEDIHRRLHISLNTLKSYLKHLYAKTGTANRKELILLVMKRAAPAVAGAIPATAEAAVSRAEAADDMTESPT